MAGLIVQSLRFFAGLRGPLKLWQPLRNDPWHPDITPACTSKCHFRHVICQTYAYSGPISNSISPSVNGKRLGHCWRGILLRTSCQRLSLATRLVFRRFVDSLGNSPRAMISSLISAAVSKSSISTASLIAARRSLMSFCNSFGSTARISTDIIKSMAADRSAWSVSVMSLIFSL